MEVDEAEGWGALSILGLICVIRRNAIVICVYKVICFNYNLISIVCVVLCMDIFLLWILIQSVCAELKHVRPTVILNVII